MRLPRLLGAGYVESARLNPSKLSLDEKLVPLSKAQMTLPWGEPLVSMRQWVEVYKPSGSAGLFRVASEETRYGVEQTVSLNHGIATLGEARTPAETTLTGTIRAVMSTLLSYQKTVFWQLGTCPNTGSHSFEVNKTAVLQGVTDFLKTLNSYALSYDFSTSPWTLNVVTLSDTPMCECRLSRNMGGAPTVRRDDTELFTRVLAPQLPNGYLNGSTVGTWGVIEHDLGVPEDANAGEVTAYAQAFLEAHKDPTISVEIDALELAKQTGETLDAFDVGKLCRMALPDYEKTVNERVVEARYDDLLAEPESVRLTLSTVVRDMSNVFAALRRETDALQTASVGHGGGIRKTKNDLELAETAIEQNQYQITLRATTYELNALNERVVTAEATLTVHADAITMKVSKGDISSTINQTAQSVLIEASKINLVGYVTASKLSAEAASIRNEFAYQQITAHLIVGTSIQYQGWPIARSSLEVVTSVRLNKDFVNVPGANGVTYYVVSSVSLSVDKETIGYLGY